ncbi:MAG: sigma-70 family RNA polymerase sigma factor [Deltaproteobacteria bacterium]|nr:sigma-70 family RNA polymerase sigma factor [Deltaproteobacteria bacterium]
MSDSDVHLAEIAAGDPDAFGCWVAGVEERLRLSLRSFASQVDTEAVLQETLLRVWQVAPRFVPDGSPDSLLRLGIRTARNLALSQLRRRAPAPVEPAHLEALSARVAEPQEPDAWLRKWIRICRKKLPARPARALEARLASGGEQPDLVLAERLEMRLNTFLQNLSRARRLLAECLEKHGVDIQAVRS